MAYPYKKMTSQDCDYIRSVTAPDRVWVGEEIASEYYRDEMPEYGVYQPDLYESGPLRTDERFCPLYRGSYAGRIDHEFFIQCCEKYDRI